MPLLSYSQFFLICVLVTVWTCLHTPTCVQPAGCLEKLWCATYRLPAESAVSSMKIDRLTGMKVIVLLYHHQLWCAQSWVAVFRFKVRAMIWTLDNWIWFVGFLFKIICLKEMWKLCSALAASNSFRRREVWDVIFTGQCHGDSLWS